MTSTADIEQAARAIQSDRKPRREALRIGRFERVPLDVLRPVGKVAVDDDARHRRHDDVRPGMRQERRENRQQEEAPFVHRAESGRKVVRRQLTAKAPGPTLARGDSRPDHETPTSTRPNRSERSTCSSAEAEFSGWATTRFELPVPLRQVSTIIDAAGLRTMPGLIDGHVHVTGGGGEAGFRTRVPPVPLSRFTTAGITTVVGLLGTDDVARGPSELLATLYALREEGLNAYGYAGGYHVPPATLTGSVRGDLVFVEALIGIGEVAISDHRSSQPTLRRVAAHRVRMPRRRRHDGQGRHSAPASGRRSARSRTGAGSAGEERAAGARLQSHPREPAARVVRGSGRARAARIDRGHHGVSRRGGRRCLARRRSARAISGLGRAAGPRHHQLRCGRLPPLLRCRRSRDPHGRRFRRRVAGDRCAKRWRAASRSKRRCPPLRQTPQNCCGSRAREPSRPATTPISRARRERRRRRPCSCAARSTFGTERPSCAALSNDDCVIRA